MSRRHFNPRAPCGARRRQKRPASMHEAFQSTRPVWGATNGGGHAPKTTEFQSTRPVWGATQTRQRPRLQALFQSTRPVWGATHGVLDRADLVSISIHAPRVGRDSMRLRISSFSLNFNPRAPCGARPEYADH